MKNSALTIGFISMGLAVILGAFGAHGLKKLVTEELLKTFETGSRYHIYHSLGLMLMGVLKEFRPHLKLHLAQALMVAGIILFSFNCYLYVLSGAKFFAMIVPVGGLCFIIAWLNLAYTSIRPGP